MMLRIEHYYNDSKDAVKFSIGVLEVYFSYTTPVAFRLPGVGLVVRQNDFSVTTGRHLGRIDGGKTADRVDRGTFERLLEEHVSPLFRA